MTDQPAIEPASPSPTPATAPAPATSPAVAAPGATGEPPADISSAKEPATAAVDPKWREDWREALAGDDEKLLGKLKRYQSVDNVFKAYTELERKVSAGALKTTLPENPTEQDIAQYRKSWGVPETPEGYGIEIPEAAQMSEPEKANISKFLADMHGVHAPASVVNKAMESYFAIREAEYADLAEVAQNLTMDNKATIKAEWGKDYDSNVNLVNAEVLETLGSEQAQALPALTLADGTKLGDNPLFLRYVAAKARASLPEGVLAMSDLGVTGSNVEIEYQKALNLRFEDPTLYHSEAHQAKLLRLAAANAKAQAGKSRAA